MTWLCVNQLIRQLSEHTWDRLNKSSLKDPSLIFSGISKSQSHSEDFTNSYWKKDKTYNSRSYQPLRQLFGSMFQQRHLTDSYLELCSQSCINWDYFKSFYFTYSIGISTRTNWWKARDEEKQRKHDIKVWPMITWTYQHISSGKLKPTSATPSMGTLHRNRVSKETKANNGSLDSLSFTDLVCIQDQQSKSIPTMQINKHNHEFEFSTATPGPRSITQNSPAVELIPNNQLQLHAFLCQSKQSHMNNLPCYKETSPSSQDSHSRNVSQKSNHEVRNQANKGCTAKSSSFAEKLFQSFVSPCRECHACQPTVKHIAHHKKMPSCIS